jgi:hypothetical protein
MGDEGKALFMKSIVLFGSTLALTTLSAVSAHAAVVAVMPVQGVNLLPGQCDAIGVLFARAFARETNVSVASPLETGPLLAQGMTAPAASARLGASEYVNLRALQMGNRVSFAGIRYGVAGNEVFRSETSAPSLDDMELAASRLARALAWRQSPPSTFQATPPPVLVESPITDTNKPYPKALGMKAGLVFPWSPSHSYQSMMSLQFDGRIGSRSSFIEFGGGVAFPTASSGNADIRMWGVFAELGGSVYLSDSAVGPYIGGGVSPRIWSAEEIHGNNSADGATCALYGQAGITFTRDSRGRLYTELRVSQYVIGLNERYQGYSYGGETSSNSYTLYPTEFSLQFGVGW